MSGQLAAGSLIRAGQLFDEPIRQWVGESADAAGGDEAAFEEGFGLCSGEGRWAAFGLDDREDGPTQTKANHLLQHLGLMRLGLHVHRRPEQA